MKVNKMNGRKPQRGSQFFEGFIRDFGEDFLNKVQPLMIRKKAHLLFRDIAHGNIDITKYGKYFMHEPFVEIMVNESWCKRYAAGNHVNGLNLIRQMSPSDAAHPQFDLLFKSDMDTFNAYVILNDGLAALANSKDVNYIGVIANNIRPFKYAL